MITSYYMGSMFVSVYGASADTILHCYCIDEELNHEILEQAKFVPSTMQQFLEENSLRGRYDDPQK